MTRRPGSATNPSRAWRCCGSPRAEPTRPARRSGGCSARPPTRSTARSCCPPPWKYCWPQDATTRPPESPPSSDPSPPRSAARRCRHAPTTPPRSPRWSPATRQPAPSFRRAWAVWERLGWRYEIARSRMQLGRALRALGDEESAAAEIAAARRGFAELGAGTGEREAAALISAPAYPAGLTAREAEVLRHVAAGKTNPEIARELYLSDKTIARHLSNIFTKLGGTSRTAAAAFAYEHHISPGSAVRRRRPC
ncbi:MAG TPA: LuxR C-terminal-related transcriptional regulator [Streptosporangiaceae bacterium]|nr:LuxR C-terminal-related transcriptional regulator [Streptosporangiaceae bacterium]